MDVSSSAKFLGKLIPECHFHRVNDSKAVQERIKVVFSRRLGVLVRQVMMVAGSLGVALAGIYWYMK
jgi:hypothetical protein